MKIVYMGTPDFAVLPLRAMKEAGFEVAAVVTQPDKPKGRGKTMMPTPVKEEAVALGIPVYQPVKVKEPEFLETLKEIAPDIIVVAAFGQIIPKTILNLPRFGCINIHASLTERDCTGHYRSGCFRTDYSKNDSEFASFWMHQHSCLSSSKIQRRSSHSAGSH